MTAQGYGYSGQNPEYGAAAAYENSPAEMDSSVMRKIRTRNPRRNFDELDKSTSSKF